MNYWKVILATMLIFGSGVLTGSLVTRQPAKPRTVKPAPPLSFNQMQRAEFLTRLDQMLSLTPGQHEVIGRLLKESNDRTRPLWEPVAVKVGQEITLVREQIRAELAPAQQEIFDREIGRSKKPARPGALPSKDPKKSKKKKPAGGESPTNGLPRKTSGVPPQVNSLPQFQSPEPLTPVVK